MSYFYLEKIALLTLYLKMPLESFRAPFILEHLAMYVNEAYSRAFEKFWLDVVT